MDKQQLKPVTRVFDSQATEYLIQYFGKKYFASKGGEILKVVKEIVNHMESKGWECTGLDVSLKFKSLKTAYIKFQREQSKGRQVTWKHFKSMHQIFGMFSQDQQTASILDASNFNLEPEIKLTEHEEALEVFLR